MTNVLRFGKTAFTWAVVAVTVVATMGVAPLAANAQTSCPNLQSGDLFKVAGNSAVFLLDANLNRMYFPHSSVYNTWYSDFSGVQVIPSSCVSAYPTRTNTPIGVNYRAGSHLVKETIVNTVYAVLPGNMISAIGSEAVAAALYGPNWASLVMDVPASFFANYANSGNPLTEMKPHDGQFVKEAGSSDVYYVEGGMRHMVDGTPRGDVRTVSASVLNAVPMGSGSKTAASVYADPTQGATSSVPGPGPVVPSGSVSVSLSANTPASRTAPASSTHVGYLTFVVSAGSQAAVVDSIEFERHGLGSSSNFSKVWLEVNGAPVSNEQSVSSDNTVLLSPNYSIPANGSVEFTLVANLAGASTAQQDGFRIVSASKVRAGGSVTGSFPVSGNLMTYSSYPAADAAITHAGSSANVEVGEVEVVGEFEITYTPSTSGDSVGMFKYLRLKMEGTANMSDLANLGVYENGVLVSSAAEVSGDYVTFRFSGANAEFEEDGETRRFEIKADIVSGDNSDTIIFELKDNRDAYILETATGFGATLTNTINGATTNQLQTYTLDAGQLSISLDASSPTTEQYAKGAQDIVALIAKVDAGQAINVDGIYVTVTGTVNSSAKTESQADADIKRAELWINGSQRMTVTDVEASGATLRFNFNRSMVINDNDLIEVRLDLEDNAVTGTYSLTLNSSSWQSAEYRANGDSVPTAKKTGSAQGANVEIVEAGVTISENDGYVSGETFVVGSVDHMFMRNLFTAGSASSVKVRTLDFDFGFADPSLAYTYMTGFYLMIDGVRVGDISDMTSAGEVVFTNLNYVIPASGQAQIALYGRASTALSATSTTVTVDVSESLFEDGENDTITSPNGGTDVTSPSLSLATSASLSIVAKTDLRSKVVVAGGSNAVDLASFTFSATTGAVRVKKVFAANVSSTAAVAATSTADSRVNRYELVVDGQVLRTIAPVSGKMAFDLGSNAFTVPKNSNKVVTIRAVFNSITQASATGKKFMIDVYGVQAETVGPNTLLSTISSGTVAASDDTTFVSTSPQGQQMMLAATAPTLATVSLGTQNALAGDVDFYSFTVTADASGPVSWSEINLAVSGACSGAGTGSPAACLGATSSMRIEEGSTSLTATFSTSSGSVAIVLSSVETVSAGQSKTYTVSAPLTGFTSLDNDTLTVRVRDNQSAFGDAATNSSAQGSSTTFVWSDNSGLDEDTSVAQWFTGYRVNGLDTGSYTLN